MKNSGNFMNLSMLLKPRLNPKWWLQILSIMLLSTMSILSHAKQITVKTDRQTVEMGDVITLVIQADFQVNNSQLNLTKLKDQFDVLSQQQSNQVEIINGKYNSFTRWQIQILPKQLGKLVIPPFTINGVQSQAYPINVLKAQFTDSNRPYFLEAQVDKTQVYVQEQVIYTLRFYHKGSLINGNIRPPKFDDALVEQLKEQSVYGKTINKQQYTVYEWQYAFFPQSSGQIDIPGPSFTGMVQLRGGQKGIRAIAEPISLEVKPKLSNELKYWLPASSVELSQEWQNLPQTVQVGDSLRRVITVKFEGLKTSQLPEIKTPNGDNFKVYPDTSKKKQELSSNGVTSTVTLSQAIVPSAKGTLQIPDLTLTWLNTKTNKLETAVLKSKPIAIWASNASVPNVISGQQSDTQTKLNIKEAEKTEQQQAYQNYQHQNTVQWYWVAIAFVASTIWMITLLFLIKARAELKDLRSQIDSQQANTSTQNQQVLTFNKQWCDLPLNEFYKELLRQLHEDMQMGSVNEIDNPILKNAILQLESHLFAGEKLGFKTMQEICDNWAALINRKNKAQPQAKTSKKQELASLYNK